MKINPKVLMAIVQILTKQIGLLLPIALSFAIYKWVEDPWMWIISFYFYMISRSQLELYEKLDEIKEAKDEDQKLWKTMLSKRKSF